MSTLPQIKAEDKPPMLRFVRIAEEDRIASEETGHIEYKDVVKVYVKAAGDTKCEVPFLAKDVIYVIKNTVVDVKTEITRTVRDPKTGESIQVQEPVTERVEKEVKDRVEINPWLIQLKDKLRDGFITDQYYDYCKRAYERFMASETAPVDGVPLADWRGATEAMKKKAIDIGVVTVQALAEMNEETMQNIGMGAREMKRKAIQWLEANDSPLKAASKIVNLEEENKALTERLSMLERAFNEQQEEKRRGRPPKSAEAA